MMLGYLHAAVFEDCLQELTYLPTIGFLFLISDTIVQSG